MNEVIYIQVYIYIDIHADVCVYERVYIYTYICIHADVCDYERVDIYTYSYAYMLT